jgi:hypothetical protein
MLAAVNARDFSALSTGDLVDIYAAAAVHHQAATAHGDAHGAQLAFGTVGAAYGELRSRGPEAQRALLPLLGHASPAVRLAAGAHALEFAPEEGEPVLEELAAEDETSVAFDAALTLEVWRAGDLRFP